MTQNDARPNNRETVQSIMDSLRRIVRALRISSRGSERTHGLSAAQLFVMHQLALSTRPLSMNDLADVTFTHQSSVSVVVSRLVDRGLVGKRNSNEDARRAEVFLTDAGRILIGGSPRTLQDEIVDAIGAMGPDRSHELSALLEELVHLTGHDKDEISMLD